MPALKTACLVLALLLAGPCVSGSACAGDVPPRGLDLDRVAAARVGPERLRWFFSPTDVAAAETAAAQQRAGVERVAILSTFDDRWILEAPADSVAGVETAWGALGALEPDESGTPALLEATALVGADAGFFADLDLEGDVASTVAFLDSGCDTAHDDLGDPDDDDVDGFPDAGDATDWSDATDLFAGELAFRIVGWHDVTDDLPLAVGPWDDHFHGTALASAGFGGGQVDPDQHGVAPQGRFVVVKTWNFEGRWERWASDFFLGVEWLIANSDRLRVQACVVGTVWSQDHGFEAAVDALADRGILLIAPTGNDGAEAGWPARVGRALGVGAATTNGRISAFSNRAPTAGYPPQLDVVAPGGSLLDADGAILVADNEPNDTYRGRVGTSLAAAMVGGAVSIVAETARESGARWPEGPDRVSWLTDLLCATSVELAAAEPGAFAVPPLDRGGYDRMEGYGLVQVPAATQAVNNVLWPGDRADFALASPAVGRAAWACRLPGSADAILTLSVVPSSTLDVDLHVYLDTGDHLQPLARSTRPGQGVAETVQLEHPPSGDLVVVARWVSGAGDVIFDSLQRFGPSSLWPRELRSRQTTAPVAADLDGDGQLEVVLTNTFAVDRRVHEFVVFDARGRSFRFFPRSVDSSPYFGRLSSPVVGRVGERTMIVASSDFGRVFAVSDSAQVLFSPMLTPGLPLTAPVLWEEGPAGRVLVGSQTGVQVVNGLGQIEAVLPLGAAVAGQLAAGDLDADGTDEIVAVSAAGLVHAIEIDGTPLPGWPVALAGEPGPPVLIGRADAAGVERVIVSERTSAGELLLHDFAPDGTEAVRSPWTLDRGGLPLLASSRIAAAAPAGGEAEIALGAALGTWDSDQVYRLWRLRPASGDLVFDDEVYSRQSLQGMLHLSRGLVVDEPRVLDQSGAAGLEVVQTSLFDWNEAFVGNPRRYGSSRQITTWRRDGSHSSRALGPGHESFPEVWGQSPLICDLEGDGYPDWIVVRDTRVTRSSTRMRWTLDGMWAAERGGRTRSACVGCEGPRFVGAPPAVDRLALGVFPNPFNPRTTLEARLAAPGRLRWAVYDARGRRVRHWEEFVADAGVHRVPFDGTDQQGNALASGVYFVQLHTDRGTARTRMVLVR